MRSSDPETAVRAVMSDRVQLRCRCVGPAVRPRVSEAIRYEPLCQSASGLLAPRAEGIHLQARMSDLPLIKR